MCGTFSSVDIVWGLWFLFNSSIVSTILIVSVRWSVIFFPCSCKHSFSTKENIFKKSQDLSQGFPVRLAHVPGWMSTQAIEHLSAPLTAVLCLTPSLQSENTVLLGMLLPCASQTAELLIWSHMGSVEKWEG